MSDPLQPTRELGGPHITVVERPTRACINLRGDGHDPKFAKAVASVTDLVPPVQPCTSVCGLFASQLWLGPDEWLVVSETQSGAELGARLRQALRGMKAAVTDVGAGRIVYALSGMRAREVLAKGCSLDLHPRVFVPGQCAQTVLAKLSVLIHRSAGESSFDLYLARSFGDYAWAWLERAATEYR